MPTVRTAGRLLMDGFTEWIDWAITGIPTLHSVMGQVTNSKVMPQEGHPDQGDAVSDHPALDRDGGCILS